MKKIHAFLFLFLLSPLSFADSLELNIFSNGQVADADEVNENFQLLETVPTEAHDVPMDGILTENGIYFCGDSQT